MVSLLFAACFYPETGINSLHAEVNDSILNVTKIIADTAQTKITDSITTIAVKATNIQLNTENIAAIVVDTTKLVIYKPDPKKAVWYSALCPGLGQLYNRRYWKLPFIGAGIVGLAYAIGWNSKYYDAYTNAYRDIADNDPKTTSYLKLVRSRNYNVSQLTTVLKNRQETFRRSRDLSYIGAAGVYLLCILDAYVDAQLYDFDISPDLSILPQTSSPGFAGIGGVELSLAFHF